VNEPDLETARQVLARCAGHDPWFPNPDPIVVAVWAEQFRDSGLSRERLVQGVFRAYRDNGSGFRPLPKDIIAAARLCLSEQALTMTDEQRAEYEALCDAKAAPDDPALPPGSSAAGVRAGAGTAVAEARVRAVSRFEFRPPTALPGGRLPTRDVPAPVPCPDCGSPEPCEHDNDNE
jgi:hypothetical protein